MRLLVVESDAQALAAAAGGGLDHHRVADVLGDPDRLFGRIDGVVVAGNDVDLGFQRQLLRGDLVAHLLHRVVLRPDEDDALLLQPARERGVLGQEAVSRMHRFGAGLLAGGDDLVHRQVGFLRRRRPDADRLVGHGHVHRILVRLGIYGDSLDAHLAGGLDHSASDLATVCNQYFFEHAMSSIQREAMNDFARGERGSQESATRQCCSTARSGRRSERSYPRCKTRSEGNVAVLAPGILDVLAAQHRQ